MANLNINPEALLKIPGKIWIFWKDQEGRYLGCNDFMAEDIKLSSRKDIIGKNEPDLFTNKQEIEHYIDSDKEVITNVYTKQFQDTATLPHIKRIFTTMKSPILSESGEIVGVVGFSYSVENESPKNRCILSAHIGQIKINDIQLTQRESEIIHLLIRGKSAKETGKLIFISYRTVEKHIENIKIKLGTSSKGELIDLVLEHFSNNEIAVSTSKILSYNPLLSNL